MNSTHPPCRAVAFAIDGVLADTEILSAKVLATILSERLEAPPSAFSLLRTVADVEVEVWVSRLRLFYGCAIVPPRFEKHFRSRVAQSYKDQLSTVADFETAISSAPADRRIIVSNAPLWKIEFGLLLTGLTGYFIRPAISSYNIGSRKPNPGPYIAAAEALRCKPEHLLVVEDGLAGAQSASAAGAVVIHYARDASVDAEAASKIANYSVSHHSQTARIISRLVDAEVDIGTSFLVS